MAIRNEYYAAINGEQQGPFNSSELEAMITGGEIDGNTLVWCEDMEDWAEAIQVPELAELLVRDSGKPEPEEEEEQPVIEASSHVEVDDRRAKARKEADEKRAKMGI